MNGRWPRPTSQVRYAWLATGAAAGVAAALLAGAASLIAAVMVAVGFALYGMSHASAVQSLSPRLSAAGATCIGACGGFLVLALFLGVDAFRWAGALVGFAGVACLGATQWFDHRRTFGMAGVGLAAGVLGFVAVVSELGAAYMQGAPVPVAWGGPGPRWAVGVSWVEAMWGVVVVWFGVSGLWLLHSHSKAHQAARPQTLPA